MGTAITDKANLGPNANTTPLQRWVYAVNDWIENGNGSQKQLYDLWKAAGQPTTGTAYAAWAESISLNGAPAVASDLARLLEQKVPGGNGQWVDEVDYNTRQPL